MPTIPRTQPRVIPGQSVPMGAQLSDAEHRATGQLGQTMAGIGLDLMQQETRQRLQEEEARQRTFAVSALGDGRLQQEEALRGISERVLRGELDEPAARAEWQERRGSITASGLLDGLDANRAAEVKEALRLHGDRLAVEQLDGALRTRRVGETKASLLANLETFERDAIKNRPQALAKAGELLGTIGPAADLGPEQQQRLMQTFREKTAANLAEHLMNGAADRIDVLDALKQRLGQDEFADLSPDTRERLEVRIGNRRAQVLHAQEVAARRVEAARERKLREAEHAAKAVQSIIDGGSLPDDATLSEATKAASGTPWAKSIQALVAQGGERAAFGSLTPWQQDEELTRMRGQIAAKGASPAALERIKTFEGIRARTRDAIDKDPLAWGVGSRLVPDPGPLRLDGGIAGLLDGVRQRVDEASTVGAQLRRPVSPLYAHEAQQVGEMLDGLPLDQKKQWVRQIGAALPPEQYRALAGQLKDKSGALALAMHAASLPRGSGPDALDLILRGDDAVRAGRIKTDDPTSKAQRAKIARELDAVPWPTPKARDAATEAAGLVLDGLRDGKRGGAASEREALRVALGAELVDWGDGRTVAPPGWSEHRFTTAMRKLSPADVGRQARGALSLNGQALTPEALVQALPSARLMPAGPGSYYLDLGGVVLAPDRRPFVLRLE